MGTNGLTAMGGDEDNWGLLPAPGQFALKIGAAHPRHFDVQDETLGLDDTIGRKELLGSREGPCSKSELPD